jgi:hypothetical protein
VKFDLRDRTGKPVAGARVVGGPIELKKDVPVQPNQAVIEFPVAIYDYAPEPGERYLLRGTFPSGRFFGRPTRFTLTSDPLPEEPWEQSAAAPPGKAKPRKRS